MALKVPGLIQSFNNTYPDIELEFKSAISPDLIEEVMNYQLDAAFITAPVTLPDLEQRLIKEEQLVIVSSGKYETLNDILEDPQVRIIVFEQGCVYRARLESWLSYQGIINYKSTVVNSLEGIVNFVEAGLAITILPLELIEQYYPNRKLRTFSIGKELGSTKTMIIYRKNREQDPLLKAFVEMHETSSS